MGTIGDQQSGQVQAHLPQSLDGHPQAIHGIAAEPMADRRPHGQIDAIGGSGRRVAAMLGTRLHTAHVGRSGCHHADIVHADARVLASQVASAKAFNEVAHRLQQALGLVPAGVADDHRLAAAKGESGQRRLAGHALGQPQRVPKRFRLAGVGVHAAAPRRRPQGAVVHRDDGVQAGFPVVPEGNQFVAIEGFVGKHA